MRGNFLLLGVSAFAIGILSATSVAIPGSVVWLGIFFGILFLASYVLSQRIMVAALGTVCILFCCGCIRVSLAPHELPSVFAALISESESIRGTVISDPDLRQKNQQVVLETIYNNQSTRILIFAPLYQHIAYGETLIATGTLTKPLPFAGDGGRTFRYDHYLAKKGIYSVMLQSRVQEVSPPKGMVASVANAVFALKHTFVEGLARAISSPYADLATGLLTGNQHGISDALEESLALSGLIWVVVLSGYHVTLIAGAVLSIFSFLPQRLRYLLAGISVMILVFATGASAPSIRGGMMACLTLFARSTGRTYDALRALAATVFLILLWNPLLLAYDQGFQLSIVVTPALLIGTPILERRLLWIRSAFLREVVAVSVVAQCACVPLILWQTGTLGVWAVPANMLVMPFVPVSMLCSMIAGVVGVFVPVLAPVAGLPAYAVLYYIAEIAKISATLPFAGTIIPAFSFVWVVVMYAGIVALGWWLKRETPGALAPGVSRLISSSPVVRVPTPPHSKSASP